MKYCIKRHINNITLNPFEYVLDDAQNVLLFDSELEAVQFLNSNNIPVLDWNQEQWADDGIYIEEYIP